MHLIVAFFILLSAISTAKAQDADAGAPVLLLSSPFATSLFQLDATPDGSLAVTSSSEGVASLWNLTAAGEPEMLRTPLRDAERTRISGVAISPNGRRVALALPPLAGSGARLKLGTGLIALFDNKRRIKLPGGNPDGLTIPAHAPKLKFSPDGAYLVATLGGGCGIRIWRTADWSLFASDDGHFAPPADLPAPYCGTEAKEMDAGPLRDFNNYDIVFQSTKSDLSAPVWFSVSGKIGVQNFKMTASGVERVGFAPADSLGLMVPRSLALDAAGRRLAVGDNRRLRVAILDAETLTPLNPEPLSFPERYIEEAERGRGDTHLSQVAWVRDSGKEWLVAGGYIVTRRLSAEGREAVLDPDAKHRFIFREYLNNIVRWDPDRPDASPGLLAYGNETIMSLRPAAAGGRLLAMALNSLGELPVGRDTNAGGGGAWSIARQTALDFRSGILAASPDGKSVLVKNYEGSEKILQARFSLKDLYLTASNFDDEQFTKPLREDKFRLPDLDPAILGDSESWTQRLTDAMPRFFAKDFEPGGTLFDPANFDRTDISRAAALSSDRHFVLWGSANALRLVEDGGTYSRVICSEPLRREAMLVTFAAKDTLAIVAHSDGTIRWYDILLGDGTCRFALKLTLYAEIHNELSIWTAFRPDGIFYSPHLNSEMAGWQAADKFGQMTLDNLRKFTGSFLRSDVIQDTLDLTLRSGAPKSAPETGTDAAEAVTAKMPDYDIEILNSENTAVNETVPLVVQFRVRFSEDADPLMNLQMRVNGKPAAAIFQGRRIPAAEKMIIRAPGDYEATVVLPFSAKEKQGALQLTLFYGSESRPLLDRTTSPPVRNFLWQGQTVESKPRRIYALLVGLSDYDDQNYKDLRFAYQDAVFVAKVLMNDYEREVDRTGSDPRNFVHLNIDLILSPPSDEDALLLLKDLEQQAERIRRKEPDGLTFTYRLTRSRPDNFADDEAHDQIISGIGELADLAGHDEQNFKDVVLLYLSGHGAARRSGDGADNFLITPTAPSYLSKPNLFPAKAVNLTEAVKPLINTSAEVMIFLDACRTYINDLDLSAKIYDSLGRTLPHALLFIAAELGYETVALSFDQFPRRYPDPFKGLAIPSGHLGNSIFTHAFLLSLHCQDTALETRRGLRMDPMTIRSFIYRWYQPDTQDMVTLLDKTKMSNIRQPRIRDESYLDTKHWFRQFDPDPEFRKCIKSAGF
jgi:hypothetical protein